MAITQQRAPAIAERHAQELDWLGYVATALLRQEDPDEAALFALGAIADVVHASHARIFRLEGSRRRLIGECVEGVARRTGSERVRLAGKGPVPLRRVRSRIEPGAVIPMCVDVNTVAEVHVLRGASVDLDATARTLLDRLATMAGAAICRAEREQEQRAQAEQRPRGASATGALAIASEELREPVTALTGYFSLLDDGDLGDISAKLRQALPQLRARLAELGALTSAMLEAARLEEESVELRRSVADVREIADEAVRRCEPFRRGGQLVALRCDNGPAFVFCDRDRIVTAIANLVHNAIKYSVDGGDVHCSVGSDDSGVRVVVRDEGVGIAEADQERIFARFGRIAADGAQRAPGSGLGLYLAREFARMHGGDITVDSEPGAGSTFTLSLPRAT